MRRVRLVATALGAVALTATFAAAATADSDKKDGYVTSQDSMLTMAAGLPDAVPIITVGDVLPSGYRFEAIPDGLAVWGAGNGDRDSDAARGGGKRFDLFVNHETSTVAFPYGPTSSPSVPPTKDNSQNDFENSQLARLTISGDMEVLDGDFAIASTAGFHRFCSNYIVSGPEGFNRPILFTNEEATDWVDRDGQWLTTNPAGTAGTEQLGLVVAYDIKDGTYKPIYGMGRHNHENAVGLRRYGHPVVLSGDDTFSAPASQLYLYTAPSATALLTDAYSSGSQTTYSPLNQRLWAFRANDSNDADAIAENDYGDLLPGETVSGSFIPVPEATAKGNQSELESWSNSNNVFQFIRVEDIAPDRKDPNVVYFADTGEPRALQHATDPATNRLSRGPSGTTGPYPNGRIFKMVLDEKDPTKVLELSVLLNADPGGYFSTGSNPTPEAWRSAMHNPDNIETTEDSLLIQEDPGSHSNIVGETTARIWLFDLGSPVGSSNPKVVASVDQSADGGLTDEPATLTTAASPAGRPGSWESSGIVDASSVLGKGWFLTTVQAHTLWVDTAPGLDVLAPAGPDWTYKREGGQLLAIKIPGA